MKNIDQQVVHDFGAEWKKFDQTAVPADEMVRMFEEYFSVFPWKTLPKNAQGFDLGCGSGRWAKLIAPRIGKLYCIDPSTEALAVARRNLAAHSNCTFEVASVDSIPLPDNSMDFGYSLGVLHHIPDTQSGINACVQKLKIGAPFLVYLYYAFDNRPWWFISIWKISDFIRRVISASPQPIKYLLSQAIAALVYFPIARTALLLEKLGFSTANFPLAAYRDRSFYSMRTDALDRFGTRLEKRFSKAQIREMMEQAGLEKVVFSEKSPFWCAVGIKK